MKKVVSIVAMAVMAGVSSFAELPLFPMQKEVGFDGLFGVKFGERMPSNVAVTPSPDGTLLTQLEPKDPEFVFQEYYACLLPQTYVVVGFAAADTFKDGELDKCNEAYGRCRKAVEKRFGKKKQGGGQSEQSGSKVDSAAGGAVRSPARGEGLCLKRRGVLGGRLASPVV